MQTERHYMRSVTMGSNVAQAAEQSAHSNIGTENSRSGRASYAPATRSSPSNPTDPDNQYSEVDVRENSYSNIAIEPPFRGTLSRAYMFT